MIKLYNFNNDPRDVIFNIVIGYAGSGKSTYCRTHFSDVADLTYHDSWVGYLYDIKDATTINMLKRVIPKSINLDGSVNTSLILETIIQNPDVNKILTNYWMGEFNAYIDNSIRLYYDEYFPLMGPLQHARVFEVPYYNEELHDIILEHKDIFAVRFVDTPRDVCYDRLLNIRNWTNDRIDMTLDMQDEMFKLMRRLDEN